jgi:TfoX/Sxy family transcriptional regulator of competence genes
VSVEAARNLALDIAERIREACPIAVRRFFGGAALVIDGLQIGFVMKGSLYLRVDELSRARFEALGAAPFTYAGAARTVTVAQYYEAPAEIIDDPDKLRLWVEEARRAGVAARSGCRPRKHGSSSMTKGSAGQRSREPH